MQVFCDVLYSIQMLTSPVQSCTAVNTFYAYVYRFSFFQWKVVSLLVQYQHQGFIPASTVVE